MLRKEVSRKNSRRCYGQKPTSQGREKYQEMKPTCYFKASLVLVVEDGWKMGFGFMCEDGHVSFLIICKEMNWSHFHPHQLNTVQQPSLSLFFSFSSSSSLSNSLFIFFSFSFSLSNKHRLSNITFQSNSSYTTKERKGEKKKRIIGLLKTEWTERKRRRREGSFRWI